MKLFSRGLIISIFFLIILAVNFLGLGVNFYTDILWFKNLNFIDSFWTIFQAKIIVRVGVWLLFSLFIYLNLLFTKKTLMSLIDNFKKSDNSDDQVIELKPKKEMKFLGFISPKRINLIYLLISMVVAFFFSSIGANSWKVVLEFLNASSFGSIDPIFNKDISFYIFKFPFYQFIYQLLSTLIIITGLIVGGVYLLNNRSDGSFSRLNNQSKYHLSILISLFFVVKAWGYRLDMFQLLYSNRGVAFGASYTDIHAQLFGLKTLSIITIILAVFIFINIFIKKTKLIIGGIVALFIASLLLNTIYPGLVQQYQVEPNEIAREAPYIKYNIKFTREAYNLDKIEKRDFDIKDSLTYNDISDNEVTINNIRLWDNRPLKATYGQLQGIRSYYSFNDIDIDRYKIDGKTQQVMLGARELNQKLLSNRAKTWVNKRLNYTHGFGLAMSPVNKVSPGGLPEFLIKDIPPQSKKIEVKQPRIYYGELTNEYVVVNTEAKEFDYPEGDKNNYIKYNGDGGVKLDTPIKRLAFALKYATLKLLLNNDINSESRLMFNRNIKSRVAKIAPFLRYDNDPYLVVDNSGELYWIHDAYTTSNRYPYSEPQNWGNYIRNSVKVVTNAYTGKIRFYIVDNSDPIIRTYQKIFPKLFTKFEDMPAGLKAHIRYPVDLFKIQAKLYSIYHMEDPTVFYNKEDLWNIPQENYAGTAIEMEPYYTLMKLPNEADESFLLMLPFTPVKKNNMISWLAAKADHDDYGQLVLYKFPKRELVYGPMQIEARIDQNSEISQQLSLWNQRGSRVIRGNLLTIPIKRSILYVEPIYLQAEQSQLPELKRVIVSYGEDVIMENNLKLALEKLFGINDQDVEKDKKEQTTPITDNNLTIKGLVNDISKLYDRSKEALKAGNWTEYGKLIKELEDKLNILQEKTEK